MTVFPPLPQPNSQSRPSKTVALAGAGISSVGSLAASFAGAPWAVVLAVALTGLATVLVQSVIHGTIPQDSADRLSWWQAYWTHRRDRSRPNTPPEQHPPA
ncbi:hypothetical protein ABZ923_40435 [Streptomyces sp. NPDC046881]|uniref:hypothetical protein n=1 Tax=Streptomyces sp. NPDC046881 TaxID=3155374 RepID=UPI0033E336A8